MWQSQRSSHSHTDNPDLVTDSASGQQLRSRTYPHGVSTPSGVAEQQQWKSAGYLTKEPLSPSSTKGQSDCGLYDSGRTDSGFISGQNLTSEQCLSSDDLTSSHNITDSSIQDPYDKEKDHKNLMRLDSGVDVGLHENFSGLSLDTHSSLNDLNSSSKSQSHDSSAPFTNINVHSSSSGSRTSSSSTPSQQPTSQQQQLTQSNQSFAPAWELYFQQDQDGDTQLHIAIIQGFIEVVYSLVQMVPHPCFLDILNDVCQTPLHLAVLTRQPRIARRLLVAGATVDVRDSNGNTALHLACQTGNLDCVKALTEPITVAETATANLRYIPYLQQVPQNLEARNYDGQMCVHLAALGGHVEVLRHLVWFGANINAREGKSGRTPLHYAIESRNATVILYLLEDCPPGPNGLQLETTTYSGFTAYQLAACLDTSLAHRLAEKGALALNTPDLDSEVDSDFDEDEIYRKTSVDYYTAHKMNGGPIDISA